MVLQPDARVLMIRLSAMGDVFRKKLDFLEVVFLLVFL